MAEARNFVMTSGGLPGSDHHMGDAASVFEAVCQRRKPHMPANWPATHQQQLQLVLLTRESLGMSWRRRVSCRVDDHSRLTITPEQSAALRDPAVFMVPHGDSTTLQAAIARLFLGGNCLDFSYPGPGICPSCGIVPSDVSFWDFLPFSAVNAPDRLFISSSAVDAEAAVGVPPDASPTLTLGVEYSLVSVVYLIWGRAHYVTQFRLKGKWLKYDCTGGGSTTASASFDSQWLSGRQVLYVYVKTDLLVAAGDRTGDPRGNSQGSDSGLSAALLRAIANVERRRSG